WPAQQPLQARPVEAVSRVVLAAGRDVLVARDVGNGKAPGNGVAQPRERGVLRGLEQATFQTFELDADGVVIAALASPPARGAGVPGARVHVGELHQRAVAPHEEMGRYPDAADLLEI